MLLLYTLTYIVSSGTLNPSIPPYHTVRALVTTRTWSRIIEVTQLHGLGLGLAQLVPRNALVHAFISVACVLDHQSTILQDAVPAAFVHLICPYLLAAATRDQIIQLLLSAFV